MAEYIDREAVKEIMKKYRCLDCTNEKSLDCLLCQLHKPFTEISKIPTADVVEVVRCKDCKFRGTDDCLNSYYSEYEGAYVDPMDDDGFCSYGERRKENAEIH